MAKKPKNKLSGTDEIVSKLGKEIKGIKGRTMKGLWEGASEVFRTSQARVPIDTGNLKGSGYIRKALSGEPSVEIGYGAEYAAAVHEMVGQRLKGQERANFGVTREGVEFGAGSGKGSYWEVGQPKYLESALRDNEREIINAVQRNAKVE